MPKKIPEARETGMFYFIFVCNQSGNSNSEV